MNVHNNLLYIAAVDNFIYLGSTLSQVLHIDGEINSRKQLLLRAAFGRLHEKVWDRTGIRVHTEEGGTEGI